MQKIVQEKSISRHAGRRFDQLRPLKVVYDFFGYADSSVLFYVGDTKVLCSVTLQQGVPPFLRGKQVGWLNAEYAMLPTATTVRKQRDNSVAKPNGRSLEISRLIGRCLRSVVDVSGLGERTITIDCDVLQADGGTRTACISGAYIALKRAVAYWVEQGILSPNAVVLRDDIAAVSVGLAGQQPLLDLDFSEDSAIDADFNFIMTKRGALVEVQGTAEKEPISAVKFQEIYALAAQGIAQLFEFFQQELLNRDNTAQEKNVSGNTTQNAKQSMSGDPKSFGKAPLFSLQNRFQKQSE